jgi:hypothetical protein
LAITACKGRSAAPRTPRRRRAGHPLERPAENVFEDVRQGYVSIERARSDYSVVVELVDGEPMLNLAQTQILRGEKQKTTGKYNSPLL